MLTNLGGLLIMLLMICNVYQPVSGGTLSDARTKLDSLKSLIYSNAKATVTLDSTALKELIKLSTSGLSKPTRRVSFSVYLKAKDLSVEKGRIVKYDAILTNDGNGYDDKTGVFVCPVAGTYMFVVDTLCHVDIWLAIKVNKKAVANVHRRINDEKIWVQLSRTVIVKLKRGDHVKVENTGPSIKIDHGGYSGFTGTLVY
ncbi:complement C1q-like protein 3 [Saccostrea cucullata]|uniref:complement C1q-like protein 3 n=1 Tax=Saccostrea cuccullata TaxID=36930 RepID=UPI002ED3B357